MSKPLHLRDLSLARIRSFCKRKLVGIVRPRAARVKNAQAPLPAARLAPHVTAALAERDARNAQARNRLRDPGRADWPPVYADPFPQLTAAVPEIDVADLSVATMGGAVAHHGLLLVRGLLSPQQVADIRTVQDEIKAASLREQPDTSGWYMPFKSGGQNEPALRNRAERLGGNWLTDSPLGFPRVLQHLEDAGVIEMISEHFQECPALSLQKSVLRTVQPNPTITGWHQDGSFLGDKVRALNVWIALSPCGGSFPASGLELIPRRCEDIFTIDPSLGREAISFDRVEEIKRECPAATPEFAAGDALIFDENLLHRTHLEPGLTEIRYALECWFFAPSHAPPRYTPFLVRLD